MTSTSPEHRAWRSSSAAIPALWPSPRKRTCTWPSSRGPALNITGEILLPRPDEGADDPWGWYAIAQYRFKRTWWLGLGTGALDRSLPGEEVEAEHDHGLFMWMEAREYKANLTWVPSEFSAIRLEVAHYADWPVNETDLHARHRWLVVEGAKRLEPMATDPDFYDAKVAGCWHRRAWNMWCWCCLWN